MIFFIALLSLTFNQVATANELTDLLTVGSTNADDIDFFLYANPLNTRDYDELIFDNTTSVSNSRYNSSNPVKLLIHGFDQNYASSFPRYVRDAYLDAGFANNSNIIVVNWGRLSSARNRLDNPIISMPLDSTVYVQAASNVYVVGKRVQEFLVFLENNGFLSGGKDIHLVGHSLGAHVAGMAGLYYQKATGSSISRITGTDPALMFFHPVNENLRLDSSDATFVDIVHTNQGQFGYVGNLGHVDFYVNGGGPVQPACARLTEIINLICSHELAPRFFAQSILKNTITACPSRAFGLLSSVLCTSRERIVFGEYGSFKARGAYDLRLDL